MGSFIAANTDNEFVKKIATNSEVQQKAGLVVAKTIGNTEVQKKVGSAVAKAVTNKENQKKFAKGVMFLAKGAVKGSSDGDNPLSSFLPLFFFFFFLRY